jgi:hypothetical protein
MKKYYIIALLLGILPLACYEDKGNYTYEATAEAIIEGIEERYTVYRFDTLRLAPRVTTLHGEDEYDYLWRLFRRSVLVDTLGREKDLVAPMLRAADTYTIVFTVTSKTTGVPCGRSIDINMTSREAQGWYVLKNIDGHTEADLFLADGGSIPDFIENALGHHMTGEARRLSYLSEYCDYLDYTDPTAGVGWAARMFFTSSREILVYDPLEAVVTRDLQDLFYRVPETIDTRAIFGSLEEAYILGGGKIYDLAVAIRQTGRFSVERKLAGGVECKLSDQVGFVPTSFAYPLLFDETSRTFLLKYTYVADLYPHPDYRLSVMPYDLAFIGTKIVNVLFDGVAYSLMRHRETGDWNIFAIAISAWDDSVNEYPVPATSGLPAATLRAQHALLDIIYYARDRQVIAYNILDGRETVIHEIPAGERLVMLKCEFDSRLPNWETPPHLLAVGTCRDDDYTVTLYNTDINTGAITGTFKRFQGKGEPTDVKPGDPESTTTVNH